MWLEVVALILLTAIAAELGWIIFNGGKLLGQSRKSLSAIETSLAETQAEMAALQNRLLELPGRLAMALPEPAKAEPSPSIRPTPSISSSERLAGERLPSVAGNPELLQVLSQLSDSLKSLRPSAPERPPEEFTRRLETFADRFESASQKFYGHVASALERLAKDQLQLIDSLSTQSAVQQAEMSNLVATLKETLANGVTAKPTQRRTRAGAQPASDGGQQEQSPEGSGKGADAELAGEGRAEVNQLGGPPAAPDEKDGFTPLHSWVVNNLDQIMNRSLNQWSKPEELMRDAPSGLRYTARLLDPDCKLVLIGVEGTPHYLALLLPGGQLGANYYDWFNSPSGVGVRVERTVTPAVLNALKTGYSVVQRGTITYH